MASSLILSLFLLVFLRALFWVHSYSFICIDELPEHVSSSKVCLFTDDTVVYLPLMIATHSRCFKYNLDHIEKWEGTWDMNFIPSKCHVIHLTKCQVIHITKCQVSNFLHNSELESVSSPKYLLVTNSKDLFSNKHINIFTIKAN